MVKIFFQNLIQLIFAPSKGWEDLEKGELRVFKSTLSADEVKDADGIYPHWLRAYTRRMFTLCFIPFIVVCSLSWFVRLIYGGGILTGQITDGVLEAFQHVLVSFVGLLLSAVLSQSIFMSFLPKILTTSVLSWGAWKGRMMNLIIYSFSFLGLITLISNVVKVKIALLELLPFYVIFIILKSCRYLEIPQRNTGVFMVLASLCILGLPYVLAFLLNAVTNV